MPQSPPSNDFDDLVKVSPPPAHIPIMPDPKVKVEHIDSSYPIYPPDIKDEKSMSLGDADVQKMFEDTVRRVREQSDRCVNSWRWKPPVRCSHAEFRLLRSLMRTKRDRSRRLAPCYLSAFPVRALDRAHPRHT